eukprot:6179972-Pleurochrysis_carterae.AAC.1
MYRSHDTCGSVSSGVEESERIVFPRPLRGGRGQRGRRGLAVLDAKACRVHWSEADESNSLRRTKSMTGMRRVAGCGEHQ